MLHLEPLPPAVRRELSAFKAAGLSCLLHGVLVSIALTAGQALPNLRPVQPVVLTIGWAPTGFGQAVNNTPTAISASPLPVQPSKPPQSSGETSSVATQSPKQAVPVQRVQHRKQKRANETSDKSRHKKAETTVVRPSVKGAKQPTVKSEINEQPTEGKNGSGAKNSSNSQANGLSQSQVMVWNAEGSPRFLKQAPLRYPRAAQRRNLEGKAFVEVSLDREGRVLQARVIRADHKDFGTAALACIQASTFSPAHIGGKPVPCVVHIPIFFVLED